MYTKAKLLLLRNCLMFTVAGNINPLVPALTDFLLPREGKQNEPKDVSRKD